MRLLCGRRAGSHAVLSRISALILKATWSVSCQHPSVSVPSISAGRTGWRCCSHGRRRPPCPALSGGVPIPDTFVPVFVLWASLQPPSFDFCSRPGRWGQGPAMSSGKHGLDTGRHLEAHVAQVWVPRTRRALTCPKVSGKIFRSLHVTRGVKHVKGSESSAWARGSRWRCPVWCRPGREPRRGQHPGVRGQRTERAPRPHFTGLRCKPKSLDCYLGALWAGEGRDRICALWGSVWGESGGSKEASAPPVREELSTGSNQVSAVTARERRSQVQERFTAGPGPRRFRQYRRKGSGLVGPTILTKKKKAKKKTSV